MMVNNLVLGGEHIYYTLILGKNADDQHWSEEEWTGTTLWSEVKVLMINTLILEKTRRYYILILGKRSAYVYVTVIINSSFSCNLWNQM